MDLSGDMLAPGTLGSPDLYGYAPPGPGVATKPTGDGPMYFTDPQDPPGSTGYIEAFLSWLHGAPLDFSTTPLPDGSLPGGQGMKPLSESDLQQLWNTGQSLDSIGSGVPSGTTVGNYVQQLLNTAPWSGDAGVNPFAPPNVPTTPNITQSYSNNTNSNNNTPVTVNVTVPGVLVGSGGIQQLTQTIQQAIITQLRQTAGLKF